MKDKKKKKAEQIDISLNKVFNIIKTFHIHEKLYKKMKAKSNKNSKY